MLHGSSSISHWIAESGAEIAQDLRGLELNPTFREDLALVDRIAAVVKVLQSAAYEIASQLTKDDLASLYGFLDITTLGSQDTGADIRNLCVRAREVAHRCPGMPYPAAVCVYPVFASEANECLAGTPIKVAVVEDAFPHGQSNLGARIRGIKIAVDNGAQEIDMVIRRGLVLEGDLSTVAAEVSALRAAAGEATLKVILNTGELSRDPQDLFERYRNIRAAGLVCIESGAHMLKTSTGKEGQRASLGDSVAMYTAISASGAACGFKAAGGVRTIEDLVAYALLAALHRGTNHELTNSNFRVGASALAGELESRFKSLPQ